jgi:hypothetical protein
LEIHESARKHGCSDDDIRHAYEHALRRLPDDDERTWYVGPDHAARLLELLVLDDDTAPLIIHADKARPKFLDSL